MTLLKAFATALAILAASMGASALTRSLAPQSVAAHPWLDQFVFKTVLAGLSLAAIPLVNRTGFAAAGFIRPAGVRWLLVWAPSLLVGALLTIVILALGSRGLSGVFANYGFAGVVFWVWFYSSFTEEIFTRGWFQSYLADRDPRYAVASSAILFGAMHLSLFRRIDPAAAAAIVLATLALGFMAARLRERYGSLVPAIVAHVSFNVGGFVGGVLFTIVYRISTGHLPIR